MSNKEYRPTLAQLRTFVTIAENKHFGTAAAKYVDAFFRNIDWEVVDRRYAAALRGGG